LRGKGRDQQQAQVSNKEMKAAGFRPLAGKR